MANPRRLIGIGISLAVVAAIGFTATKKVQALNEKKKADSVAAAASKAPAPPRPDSGRFAFGAGGAIPVVGAEVKRMPLIIWVPAMSVAASSQMVPVAAEAGGRVSRVYPKEFAAVKKGDTLMMVDTTELIFALRSAENSYKRAEVTFQNTILSDRIITDPAIRRQREEAARMSSGLQEAGLSLERARLEYAKAATRSPIDGRIANLKVFEGQRVGAGTEIMTVLKLDPILVQSQVLQSEYGKIRLGNEARMVFGFRSDTTYTGRVISMNPVVDDNLRTARVTLEVRNPGGVVVPGMTARAEIQSVTYPNRLLVPKKAILQRSDGRNMLFVYKPNPDGTDGTAEWRYVNLGLYNNEYYEIIPGEDGSQKMVEPGEIVLVDGHYTIEHTAPIRLVDKLTVNSRPL
jgi:membrane fusion protein (multidrug efflux system)